jgi:hypothetical protein
MKKNKTIKKDIVTELIDNDVDEPKLTNAWGEVIVAGEDDINEELDHMEGFHTHNRYNSHDEEFDFMNDNHY